MFTIRNIKISIKILPISLNTIKEHLTFNSIEFQEKSNYLIYTQKYMFLFYKHKEGILKHINVTKIPTFEDIEHCLNNLTKTIPILKTLSHTIDNISSNYTYPNTINIQSLISKAKDLYQISYNRERFPGLFIKYSFGTLILFHTGKIICVGTKNIDSLQIIFESLKSLLS